MGVCVGLLTLALALSGCPQGCRPRPRTDRWDAKHEAYLAELAARREAQRHAGGGGDAGPVDPDLLLGDDTTPRPETERVETLVIALPDEPTGLNPALDPDLMANAITFGTIYEPILRYRSDAPAQTINSSPATPASPRSASGAAPTGAAPPGAQPPAADPTTTPIATAGVLPGVCDNWSIDVSGRRIELQIREGARWHDGRAVTSSDLQFTLDTLRAGDSRATQLRTLLADIDRVELAGPRRIRLLYRRATWYALRNLAEIPVLPQHLLTAADVMQQRTFRRPIGSGPWRLVRWKRGEQLLLARADSYDLPGPGYRWLEFVFDGDGARVLTRAKQGDIDIIARVPPSYIPEQIASPAISAAFERRDLAPPRFLYLVMNVRKGRLLEDIRMRRAIGALIDRKATVEGGYQGRAVALATPVWPGGPISGPPVAPPPGPDLGLARRLLEYSDWWDRDRDNFRERQGTRLALRMLTASGPLTRAVTEQLVPAAREVGMVLTAARADPAFIMAKLREGDFDLALLELGGIPDQDLGAILGSEGTQNYGGVADAELDSALEALRRAEGSARVEQAQRLSRVLLERLPILTLARPTPVALVRKGIQGLEVEGGWFTLQGVRPAPGP
ncbi:MAG: hypothetical protein IT370_10460 [Deltaproteobacteria bacterium]|nr:hypothetical protein [Deltaproteobacteria bacterium]